VTNEFDSQHGEGKGASRKEPRAPTQARETEEDTPENGGEGSPEPTIEKGTGTTRKCANCGQVGHIKTNKKCVKCVKLDQLLALAREHGLLKA
jgi:hypothetical protein